MKSRLLKRQDDDSNVVDTVAELDYDPAKQFGEFLIEARMVSFQTLPNIRKYFKLIFDKAQMKSLDAAGGYISALAAVRNILTHKAGRADGSFVSQSKNIPGV